MSKTFLLKSYLQEHDKLSEKQLAIVDDYSHSQAVSFEEALIFLNYFDYKDLGSFLSAIYGIPYCPLLLSPPHPIARKIIPSVLATKLTIFPVSFDEVKNKLVVAVSQINIVRIKDVLINSGLTFCKVTFTIASSGEIKKALTLYYSVNYQMEEAKLSLPGDFTILDTSVTPGTNEPPIGTTGGIHHTILLLEPDIERGRSIKSLLKKEGYSIVTCALSIGDAEKLPSSEHFSLLLVNQQIFGRIPYKIEQLAVQIGALQISYYTHLAPLILSQENPYQCMSDSLISIVRMAVMQQLNTNSSLFNTVSMRARYCRLLAIRLQLSPKEIDSVTLAALLFDNELPRYFQDSLEGPFNLKKILSINTSNAKPMPVENNILNFVNTYLSIIRKEPEIRRNTEKIRDVLLPTISFPDRERFTELFLGVLRDEEILAHVDHSSFRLYVIDSSLTPDSKEILQLTNTGYDVKLFLDSVKARDAIFDSPPDLIISDIQFEKADGIVLCRALKNNPKLAAIPFMFLTSQKEAAAECLKAGADDFLAKPADQEVLLLKIKKMLEKRAPQIEAAQLAGSLLQINLADIIQLLSLNKKNVKLIVQQGETVGEIFMQSGEIVHASLTNIEGEMAFYQIFRWEEGDFKISSIKETPPKTITMPTMALLMESARIEDETKREDE